MIIGHATVTNGMLITHKGSYVLSRPEAFTTPRPFLGPTIVLGAGFFGWAISFADLLTAGEITSIFSATSATVFIASQVGQLRLNSIGLISSDASVVLWGHINSVQKIRSQIDAQFDPLGQGGKT